MSRSRVLIADDHTFFLDLLANLLREHYKIVGTVADGKALLEEAPGLDPDIIILDISMPLLDGIEAARKLKSSLPDARLIFLTMHEEPAFLAQALSAGASGFLIKRSAADEIFTAIDEVLSGRIYVTPLIQQGAAEAVETPALSSPPELTPRQREVLAYLADGLSMKQVAATLGLTPRTVAFHKYKIMEELGVKSNAELIRIAVEHGIKP